MRYIIIILLFSCMLPSCKKDERQRYEQRLSLELSIPSGLNLIETHAFILYDIPSLFESSLDFNGYQAMDVDEILASEGQLSNQFSSNGLNFIERISIRIYNKSNPASFKEMYYFDFVPINQDSELNVFPGIANLKKYIENENFALEVRLKFRSFVPPNTILGLDFGYRVFIKN